MNDDEKGKYLSYRAGFFTAIVIFALSMFAQWFNWYAFDKLAYEQIYVLFTPLILCMMYHFVQLDAGKHGNFSRQFFFSCAVGAPCIFSLILFFITFDLDSIDNSIRGTIAVYSARIMITSAYLLVFSVIDIPILRYLDKKEKKDR